MNNRASRVHEEFAVSDEKGNYVFYTNDLNEAETEIDNINRTIEEEGGEGSAALMVHTKNGEYVAA